MEPTYCIDDPSKQFSPILKRGKAVHSIPELKAVQPTNRIKVQKKKDVNNLLSKRFGNEWRREDNLKFYQDILDSEPTRNEEVSDENIGMCDCLEEECEVNRI